MLDALVACAEMAVKGGTMIKSRDLCQCGHWRPEHGPVVVRDWILRRYNLLTKKLLQGAQCVWCDCREYEEEP